MGFWDFFKKNRKEISPSEDMKASFPKDSFRLTSPAQKAYPVDSNTPEREYNIVLLYQFLDENYELKGYNDSLVNPDSNYLNQNIDSLKNNLFRTIKKVKTYYEDFITEADFHIDSRSRSGFVEMVEELRMKKKKAEDHLQKIMEIETNALQNTGECLGMILSYTRGFHNGLAAISQNSILNRKL